MHHNKKNINTEVIPKCMTVQEIKTAIKQKGQRSFDYRDKFGKTHSARIDYS